jgi:hypothetical protein
MSTLLSGFKNYQTTVTGILTIVFGALGQAFPEWSGVFNRLAEVFGLAFVILTKDATTGSQPGQ